MAKHPLYSPKHAGMSTHALARAKATASGLDRQRIDLELALRTRGKTYARREPEKP